jgi:DNA-binding CsgD family transcriptional regulator
MARQAGIAEAHMDTARVLSPRERQVVSLLAAGLNGSEIAARLRISPATVRTHVEHAKMKLEARTRGQAIAIAVRRGLLDD